MRATTLLLGMLCASTQSASAQMLAGAGMTTSIFVQCSEGARLSLTLRYGAETEIDVDPQEGPPGQALRIPVWAHYVTTSEAARAVSVLEPTGLEVRPGRRALVIRGAPEQTGLSSPVAIAIPWASAVMRGSVVTERCLSSDEAELVFGDRTSQSATRALQQRLAAWGFDVGTPDGRMGRRTETALAQFRAKRPVPSSRGLDDETVIALVAGR